MKKILASAVFILIAGIAQAQETQGKSTETISKDVMPVKSEPSKCDFQNSFIMKENKISYMKAGKEMPMNAEMKTTNGLVISKDGSIISKDGKKSKLKNGQYIDINGNICWIGKVKGEEPPAENITAPIPPLDNTIQK